MWVLAQIELLDPIGQFIEQNGVATLSFLLIFTLFWRQQNIQKERDQTESQSKAAETEQQNKLIIQWSNTQQMYNRLDTTLSVINDTLKTAFTVMHNDRLKNDEIINKATSTMTDMTAQSRKIAERIEDVMRTDSERLDDMSAKIDALIAKTAELVFKVDRLEVNVVNEVTTMKGDLATAQLGLRAVKDEIDNMKTRTTDENLVVSSEPIADLPVVAQPEEKKEE